MVYFLSAPVVWFYSALDTSELVHTSPVQPCEQRTRPVQAALCLIRSTESAAWDVVWPAILKDASFGLEVFTEIAHVGESFDAVSTSKLSDDQLCDLYIWLLKHVPYSADTRRPGFGAVSPAESLSHWRDSVLRRIVSRGTARASEGLARALKEFPALTWLQGQILEAQRNARRHSWVPYRPSELLESLLTTQNVIVLIHGIRTIPPCQHE